MISTRRLLVLSDRASIAQVADLILCSRLIASIYTNQSPGAPVILPQAPPAPGHGLRVPGALPEGLRGLQDRPADRLRRAGRARQRQ